MDVIAVEQRHLDPMAALLQAAFVAHRPLGATHRFADDTLAREAVAAARRGAAGFVATDGGEVAGFLLAPPTGYLGVAHHAARPSDARNVYRHLYEAAAQHLVAQGVRHHSLPLLVEDSAAIQACFELEFGIDQIDGIIEVPGSAAGGTRGQVRHATAADLDAVVALASELQDFHRRSPMFQPTDGFDAEAIRRGAAAALHDERSTVVVAGSGGRIVAMAQANPSGAYVDAFDIGMNVVGEGARSSGIGTAMLEFVLAWALDRRYRFGTVGWTSSNLVSDAFYRSRGFVPVRYRVHRRIAATRRRTPA